MGHKGIAALFQNYDAYHIYSMLHTTYKNQTGWPWVTKKLLPLCESIYYTLFVYKNLCYFWKKADDIENQLCDGFSTELDKEEVFGRVPKGNSWFFEVYNTLTSVPRSYKATSLEPAILHSTIFGHKTLFLKKILFLKNVTDGF